MLGESSFENIKNLFSLSNIVLSLVFPIVATFICFLMRCVFDTLFRRKKDQELFRYLKNRPPFNKIYKELFENKILIFLNISIFSSLYSIISLTIGFILVLVLFFPFYFVLSLIEYIKGFILSSHDIGIIYAAVLNILFIVPFIFYCFPSLNKDVEIKEKFDPFNRSILLKINITIGLLLSCYYLVYNYSYIVYCQYLNLDLSKEGLFKILILLKTLSTSLPSYYKYLAPFYILGLISSVFLLHQIYLEITDFYLNLKKSVIYNNSSKFSSLLLSTNSHILEGKIEDFDSNLIVLNNEETKKIALWDKIEFLEVKENKNTNIEQKPNISLKINVKKENTNSIKYWLLFFGVHLIVIFLIYFVPFLLIFINYLVLTAYR